MHQSTVGRVALALGASLVATAAIAWSHGPALQQGNGQGPGKGGPKGDDGEVAFEIIVSDDHPAFGAAGLFSDGLERLDEDSDGDGYGDLFPASLSAVTYRDHRIAADLTFDPCVTGNETSGGGVFADLDRGSTDSGDPLFKNCNDGLVDPELGDEARTFVLSFDAGDEAGACACDTLELAVDQGACTLRVNTGVELPGGRTGNPRVSVSSLFKKRARDVAISLKFLRDTANGISWQVDSADPLDVVIDGSDPDNRRTVVGTDQAFTLDRVASDGFTSGPQCSGFAMPMRVTFQKVVVSSGS